VCLTKFHLPFSQPVRKMISQNLDAAAMLWDEESCRFGGHQCQPFSPML
jgi:hypothetical protein